MIVEFDEKPPTLRCRGDEDRVTQGVRRQAFARAIRAQADLIVDLSELVFADASLMLDFVMLARRLRRRDRAMVLYDAQPHIRALIERLGLHRLEGISIVQGPSSVLALS